MKDNINLNIKEVRYKVVNQSHVTEDVFKWSDFESAGTIEGE